MVFTNVFYVIISLATSSPVDCHLESPTPRRLLSSGSPCRDAFGRMGQPEMEQPKMICKTIETPTPENEKHGIPEVETPKIEMPSAELPKPNSSSPIKTIASNRDSEPVEIYKPGFAHIDPRSGQLIFERPDGSQIYFSPLAKSEAPIRGAIDQRYRQQNYLSQTNDRALSLSQNADGSTKAKFWERSKDYKDENADNWAMKKESSSADFSSDGLNNALSSTPENSSLKDPKDIRLHELLDRLLSNPNLNAQQKNELGSKEISAAEALMKQRPSQKNDEQVSDLSPLEQMIESLNREKAMRGWLDFRLASANRSDLPEGLRFESEPSSGSENTGFEFLTNRRIHSGASRKAQRHRIRTPLEDWILILPKPIRMTRRRVLS